MLHDIFSVRVKQRLLSLNPVGLQFLVLDLLFGHLGASVYPLNSFIIFLIILLSFLHEFSPGWHLFDLGWFFLIQMWDFRDLPEVHHISILMGLLEFCFICGRLGPNDRLKNRAQPFLDFCFDTILAFLLFIQIFVCIIKWVSHLSIPFHPSYIPGSLLPLIFFYLI